MSNMTRLTYLGTHRIIMLEALYRQSLLYLDIKNKSCRSCTRSQLKAKTKD